MPSKKKDTPILPKMLSVRQDQYDRISKIAKEEDRSMRAVIQRMLNMYEKQYSN